MSEIERIPSVFELTLQSIYCGELITGRDHTADRLRGAAEEFIDSGKTRLLGKKGIMKSYYEQRSPRTFRGVVGEEDVLFGLAVRAEGRYSGLNNHIGKNVVAKLPIHLTINEEWGKPAAIFTPALGPNTPTMVVVGHTVNDPKHLEEIRTLFLDSGAPTASKWLDQ